ncbi:MAG: hypothetical protein LUF92_03830 [Clostridiales bacterium]|nr:hypothetical protein [Clostridiales bacterium]
MTRQEIDTFIETMEEIGDEWTLEDVERVYGDDSLEDALADRKASVAIFGDIIGTVLNR